MNISYKYNTLVLVACCASAISAVAEEDELADSLQHELKEVVVVAQENRGVESSSRIDRDAMKHLQPTSFADLLELLPGNISHDPQMGMANNITLRETGTLSATGTKTQTSDYAISSLGTQFLVDGAPMNTDANMQQIVGGDASGPSAIRTSVNRGVDMRTISTDNIESVEIVRGIPSAEYGNLTSGLVNIKRVKKATPLTLRFKADEYSKLFSAGKGFALPNTRHTINFELGYLDSKVDPRNSLENYKRVTASALPTFRFYCGSVGVNWALGLDYTGSFDNYKLDPDLNFNKIDEYKSQYRRYAFNSDLNISPYSCSWIESVVLNFSVSYTSDNLRRRKQVAPGRAAVAPSGYDEGEHNVGLLMGEYVADYRVENRPFAANLKLKANGKWGKEGLLNLYKVGLEWIMTKNYGNGQIYDLNRPLSGGWTTRPRAFCDIPSMRNISGFIEDNLRIEIGQNQLETQLGARVMAMTNLDSRYLLSGRLHIDPRINAGWHFPVIEAGKPLLFHLAGGWGKTTKLPTLDYLYPQSHYSDIIQFNYFDALNPHNSIVNVCTYKIDVTNYNLKAASNGKWEARVGVDWGNNRLSVTYFQESMSNGYRYTPVYGAYAYKKYDTSAFDPSMASISELPYQDAVILDGYRTVTNGSKIEKRGIEYTLQTQRFRQIATSLIINGAWFRSTYSNSQALYSPVSDVVGNQAVSDLYVGIYDTREGRVNEQFNTNFMLDTQVPRWGLIFTTSVQCLWYVKTTRLRDNGVPDSYISADDGKIHDFAADQESNPLLMYLIKKYNVDAYEPVKIPTAIYVNFKVSKQLGRWVRLSAFVNRIIDYLPDYKSNGLTVRRTSDAYFGMEAVIKL